MAEVHYCDICRNILKGEVYFFAYQKYKTPPVPQNVHGQEKITIEEFKSKIKNSYSANYTKINYKEICGNCYCTVEKLFKVRISKLKKIKKELDKLEKQMEAE